MPPDNNVLLAWEYFSGEKLGQNILVKIWIMAEIMLSKWLL